MMEQDVRAQRTSFWMGMAAVVVLASAVRLYHLGHESIWLDEARTVISVRQGLIGAIRSSAGDVHPPLHLVAAWVSASLAGTGEAAVRFPSAVFGVLACGLVYLLGRDMAGWRAGLAAGLFTALAPFAVEYSQEARPYALLMALTAGSMLLLWRAIRDGKRRTWVALGVVNVLLAYTHVFGLVAIAMQNACFLCYWLGARQWGKAWLGVQAATVAAFLPWGIMLARRLMEVAGVCFWMRMPGLRSAADTLALYFPLHEGQWGFGYLLVAFALLAAFGLAWALRGRQGDGEDDARRPAGVLLALWLLMPFAFTLAASHLLSPAYHPRYLIEAAPALYLLLGLGVRGLGKRLGTVVLVAGCLLAGLGLREFYRTPRRADWRELVKQIEAKRQAGDCVVICAGFCFKPFDYYCRETRDTLPRYPFLRELDQAEVAAELPGLLAGRRRVWLVLSHVRAEPQTTPVYRVLARAPWARRVEALPKMLNIRAYLFELGPPVGPGAGPAK